MRKYLIVTITVLSILFSCKNEDKTTVDKTKKAMDYASLVYPHLDTENSRWFFFSSACRPFGMVNLSPDNEIDGAWGSGYRYKTDTIKGFSHIHGWQISGVSVMPVTLSDANTKTVFKDFYSKFSHDNETVTPGYHSLKLQRYDIKTELTSTTRVGFHKYTFPENTKNAVLFNLNTILGPSDNAQGELRQISDTEFAGSVVATPTHRRPQEFKVFFRVSLDIPVTELQKDEATGNYLMHFKDLENPLLMKVAISYTSEENANLNLKTELPHWDFEAVVKDSKDHWNSLLSRIKVEGNTEKQQRRFYTDLWHALQGRRIINDVNGAYPDNTGGKFKIGQLPLDASGKPKFNHYNSDALWGAQWTLNTLWGLAYPDIYEEFAMSFLQYYKDGGLVPRGPSGGNYTYVMTGTPATPFFVSAIQKGILKENIEAIYNALKKNHVEGGIMEKAGYEHKTNIGGGLDFYMEKGFVPHPNPKGKFGGHQDGAGLTLEYAYQDWVLAQLALKLNKTEDYEYFLKRSKNYGKLLNDEGWMQAKNVDGKMQVDYSPYTYEEGFIESNGAQSTWFVPHDYDGLAELMGGKDKAVNKLNTQFEQAEQLNFTSGTSHASELHPEYRKIPINYGNQPSIQTAFIFNKLGRPDLTHYWSRQVASKVFGGLAPSTGYNGDEDQGLMGSLAVLIKIGLFQVNGGTEENPEYQIGSPIFDKVTIQLHPEYYSGKTLEIQSVDNSSSNVFIKEASFNNEDLPKFNVSHKSLTNGGVLKLEMTGTK
ncbi:glycoside hydrolase family 92 protein [Seonamhaeicola sediminis]|uniref:Glycoside hydrolase family 92 protein n=1 Tax=Seonamhaeicola sediminis TaxID=2528206 RepID=A0A562YHT5_9FLAO|nr:GH92 family glycosyl hydrolase [Seonamhaeicola sediminis]TWO34640.1 glycoside hydrolase family 92 protein [Seonamhaeicola sediminis]